MPKYKIVVATEIEYTVEGENEEEAYKTLNDLDEYLDKRYLHEATLSIEEIPEEKKTWVEENADWYEHDCVVCRMLRGMQENA